MTNLEKIQKMSAEELAKWKRKRTCDSGCVYESACGGDCDGNHCLEGLIKWLNAKHEEPMPEIKEGDCIFFREGSNVYRAMCVHGNIVYCIESGRCHIFDGKLKEDTFAIKRYNVKTGTLEDIWRADDDKR